jgi:hypothetical protein
MIFIVLCKVDDLRKEHRCFTGPWIIKSWEQMSFDVTWFILARTTLWLPAIWFIEVAILYLPDWSISRSIVTCKYKIFFPLRQRCGIISCNTKPILVVVTCLQALRLKRVLMVCLLQSISNNAAKSDGCCLPAQCSIVRNITVEIIQRYCIHNNCSILKWGTEW